MGGGRSFAPCSPSGKRSRRQFTRGKRNPSRWTAVASGTEVKGWQVRRRAPPSAAGRGGGGGCRRRFRRDRGRGLGVDRDVAEHADGRGVAGLVLADRDLAGG